MCFECTICNKLLEEAGDTLIKDSDMIEKTEGARIDPPASSSNTIRDQGKDIVMTPCGHLFQSICITKWLREGSFTSCPNCRKSCSLEELLPAYQDVKNELLKSFNELLHMNQTLTLEIQVISKLRNLQFNETQQTQTRLEELEKCNSYLLKSIDALQNACEKKDDKILALTDELATATAKSTTKKNLHKIQVKNLQKETQKLTSQFQTYLKRMRGVKELVRRFDENEANKLEMCLKRFGK